MTKICFSLIIILSSYTAWAKTNLLDLLKKNENRYGLNYYCQNFIQRATHSTLKSPDLQKLIIKASESPFFDDYYFHYTNTAAISSIVSKKGGFSEIMKYQMTYSDALSNYAGVGFYIASNPYSSANYGSYQLTMRISPDASFLDYVKHNAKVEHIINVLKSQHPYFAQCHHQLITSLIMDENNIDLYFYSPGSDWVTLFNEDVITEAQVNYINSSDASTITSKMAANGLFSPILENVEGIGSSTYYKIPLSNYLSLVNADPGNKKEETLLLIAKSLPQWTESNKTGFATIIARLDQPTLAATINSFKQNKLLTDENFFQIPIENVSNDFLNLIVNKITQTPSIIKVWDTSYKDNMLSMINKGHFDLAFFFRHAPATLDKTALYDSYANMALSPAKVTELLFYMLNNDPQHFQRKDVETQYKIFNFFLRNTATNMVEPFVKKIESLGYSNQVSFKYILNRPSLFGDNAAAFLMAYIKLKKDPALLTDACLKIILASPNVDQSSFVLYLKQNEANFGATALNVSKSIIGSTNFESLKGLIKRENQKYLNKEETDLIFSRLITSNEGESLIKPFISTFNYSGSDVSTLVAIHHSDLIDSSTQQALQFMASDRKSFSNYLDFLNVKGVRLLLTHQNLIESQKYLIDNNQDHFFKRPLTVPIPHSNIFKYLFRPEIVSSYFNQYDQTEKAHMAHSITVLYPDSNISLFDKITFNLELSQKYASVFISDKSYTKDHLELLANNLSFMNHLNETQFSQVLNRLVSYNSPLDIKNLIRSDILSFEKAIQLIFYVSYQESDSSLIQEVSEHQLNFNDLTDEQKVKLSDIYLERFSKVPKLTQDLFWDNVLQLVTQRKMAHKLIPSINLLSSKAKLDLAQYMSSSSELISSFIEHFAASGSNFVQFSLEIKDLAVATNVIQFLEKNYPVKAGHEQWMIINRPILSEIESVLAPHFENFICKKVNKYHAFADLIRQEEDKIRKKSLKESRKQMCNWNGFF